MYKAGKIMFLVAETSVHPGAGSEVGIVDLPIQRESHTEFPIIRGSSLKGALRDYFYNVEEKKLKFNDINDLREKISEESEENLLKVVFGPDPDSQNEEDQFASAISITDARILFFPVKSLKQVFAYITCPMVLKRFLADMEKIGLKEREEFKKMKEFIDNLNFGDKEAIVFDGEIAEDNYIVLEEYSFQAKIETNVPEIIKNIFKTGDFRKEKLEKHLVVLSDDDFKDFVKHSTEIVPRIKINKETGTVDRGALWYEENIPTDSIFYSLVLFSDAKESKYKKEKQKISAETLLQAFEKNLPSIFQLGGNETVGRGLISVKLYPENGNGGAK